MNKPTGQADAPFYKQPVFLSLAALLSISGAGIGVLNYYDARTQAYNADITDAALQYQRAQDTETKADEAFYFSQCWPYSTCDPDKYPQALPADTEQFQRLDALEAAFSRLHRFVKIHCQGHRDNAEKWSDCAEL